MSHKPGHRASAVATCRVLATAAVLSLAGFAGPPAANAEQLSDDFYGVNIGGVISMPKEQWDQQLNAIAASGITLVRLDASWLGAEPEPPDPVTGEHTYRWEGLDEQVTALSRHGLRWYPIIDYSTAWSGVTFNDSKSRPANPGYYAAYAGAFAARYGRGGSFWSEHPELPALPVEEYEIWNEPNTAMFWKEQQSAPEDYVDLYLASRAAIRQSDPTARVVVGGLLDAGYPNQTEDFIRRMYAHRPDARGQVDALAYHPYRNMAGIVESLKAMRRVLRSIGEDRVPIEVTEAGWSTNATSEPGRARALRELAQELPRLDLNITRLIPHTWAGAEEGGYALYNQDATPKPSGAAYTATARTMRSRALPADRARLVLRYKRGRTRGGHRCVSGAVHAASTGVYSRKVARVEFRVDRRRLAVDRRAPFRLKISRRRLAKGHHVGVRIVTLSGREIARTRAVRACRSPRAARG